MSDERPGHPATLPAAVLAVYDGFIEAMRAGDIDAAARCAPTVPVLEDDGHETGPLHRRAFSTDERHHRLLAWHARPDDRILLRSGAAWFVVAPEAQGYEIVEAGLKPID